MYYIRTSQRELLWSATLKSFINTPRLIFSVINAVASCGFNDGAGMSGFSTLHRTVPTVRNRPRDSWGRASSNYSHTRLRLAWADAGRSRETPTAAGFAAHTPSK